MQDTRPRKKDQCSPQTLGLVVLGLAALAAGAAITLTLLAMEGDGAKMEALEETIRTMEDRHKAEKDEMEAKMTAVQANVTKVLAHVEDDIEAKMIEVEKNVTNMLADGKCPEKFALVPGDVSGAGTAGVSHLDDQSKEECGAACGEEPSCCSFEWSPTSRGCNLNKECAPTAATYKDYLFCVEVNARLRFQALHCPMNFILVPGDVPSTGMKQLFNQTEECGSSCETEPTCCSFQWSPSEERCHLNKECAPTAVAHTDFLFCVGVTTKQKLEQTIKNL